MPLKGIPTAITPELLYNLARMGHGDTIVIADANFPSDSIAALTPCKVPMRITGSTDSILRDILTLISLDAYDPACVTVMDRVDSDKEKQLLVPAYEQLQTVVDFAQQQQHQSDQSDETSRMELTFMERFAFYEKAKRAFCIVQTDDRSLYANVIVSKGVL